MIHTDTGDTGNPEQQLRVGLIGGTFDPVHIGHLVVAEEARLQFNLNRVIFLPAGQPPHKNAASLTGPEHRYLMTVLAAVSNPCFQVSRFEIDRNIKSYTIDTVSHFRAEPGSGTKLFFITGADAVLELHTWKDYHELLALCEFIAASRPGYPVSKIRQTLEPYYPGIEKKVHLLENPAMAISSTFIRNRVRDGKSIKYLTAEPVEQYIKKNGLYLG